MEFLQANWPYVALILFCLSELLAEVPAFKSNSVFQLIRNGLKTLLPKAKPVLDKPKE